MLLKATVVTLPLPESPHRVAISFLVSTFHSLIVLSYDPLAKIVPSLLKVIEVINSTLASLFFNLTGI